MHDSSLFKVRLVLASLACISVAATAILPHGEDTPQPPHPSTTNKLAVLASHNFTGGPKPGLMPSPLEERAASSGTLEELFPIPGALSKWTTLAGAPGALKLNDTTFRPNHASGQPYQYVTFQGKTALKAHYPKGSYKPSATDAPKGGISFYAPGPASVDLSTAKEATFGYSIMFPKGFAFVKGGKLPGIYGGNSEAEAIGCSGGRRSSACFSARLMWRPEGNGELYTYLPPYTDPRFIANKAICSLPGSECNPTYGASIGRDSFKFEPGQWTTVAQRVKLNTAGKADGELDLFVGGEKKISVKGLILRDGSAGKMRGIQVQTFFGGSTPDWATPKDQDVYFADFSAAIIKKL